MCSSDLALAATSVGRQERNVALATKRIRGLVSALSTYVRPEGEMLQDVDVREVLEDSLRLTAHRLRDVAIERDYAEVSAVPGRAGELAQVWTNILSNAADALAGAGAGAPLSPHPAAWTECCAGDKRQELKIFEVEKLFFTCF